MVAPRGWVIKSDLVLGPGKWKSMDDPAGREESKDVLGRLRTDISNAPVSGQSLGKQKCAAARIPFWIFDDTI